MSLVTQGYGGGLLVTQGYGGSVVVPPIPPAPTVTITQPLAESAGQTGGYTVPTQWLVESPQIGHDRMMDVLYPQGSTGWTTNLEAAAEDRKIAERVKRKRVMAVALAAALELMEEDVLL